MHLAWMAALCLIAAPAAARPYTIEDMLVAEEFGRAVFTPRGDTLVVERLAGQVAAARFTYDNFTRRARSRVMVTSVATPGSLAPLFAQSAQAGYWIGGFSPSGRRLAVYRLQNDRITLGIVAMRTRRVTWLAVTPDLPAHHVNPTWIDDDRLLVVALPPGHLPYPLDFGGRVQKRLSGLWAQTAQGRMPAMTIVGSGADLQAGVRHVARRLMLVDVRTARARTLATGDIVDVAPAPDNRHIAILERGAAVPAPGANALLTLDFQSRRLRLRIVSRDGRRSTPCTSCDLAPDLLDWSADGTRLLYFARRDGEPWDRGTLQRYATNTGRDAPLDTGGVRPALLRTTPGRATPRAGWLGDRPLVFGARGTGRADWYLLGAPDPVRLTAGLPDADAAPLRIGSTGLCLLARDQLWSINAIGKARPVASGTALAIVPDFEDAHDIGTRLAFAPVRQSPAVWLRRRHDTTDELAQVSCGGDRVERVAQVTRDATILAVAPTAGVAAVMTVLPRGIARLDLFGRRSRMVDRLNGGFVAIDRPQAVALRRMGRQGVLTDWLLLPPNAKRREPLPLIVRPYPGALYGDTPPDAFNLAAFAPESAPALLAAHGYAVLVPSMPVGTAEPVDDIIAAIRPALAAALRSGWIDPARVGVLGHSYGGYAALTMATAMPCLRSVVVSAGNADLFQTYGDPDPRLKIDHAEAFQTTYQFAWAEDGQGRMGVPPWRNPARYVRNSPLYHLENVTAPILLLHGDLDPVSVVQAERSFAALYRLGKDARLVRFYGEGHVPASPGNIRARWRETLAWLDRTMAVRPTPTTGAIVSATGGCSASSRP